MPDNSRMSSLTLTPTQRRSLRAQAHHLEPVVAIGQGGLTPAIEAEVAAALAAHQLIKVKAGSDDRAQRSAWLDALCLSCHAAAVQHIGKLLVLWRPAPPAPADRNRARRSGALPYRRRGANDPVPPRFAGG